MDEARPELSGYLAELIHTSKASRSGGVPIRRWLLPRLRRLDACDGMTGVIDTPASIGKGFDVVDELTPNERLVTSGMVPALGRTRETAARAEHPCRITDIEGEGPFTDLVIMK
jgi:hypothetical protein